MFEYLLKNNISKEEEKYILSHLDFKKKIFLFLQRDIFHGHGVCINYSDMLRDLLNVSGYQSLNMLCFSNDYNSLASRANHSVNLIIEEDSPYIVDSTNFLIYGCCNNKHASLIDGVASHNLILYPYLSGIFFSHKTDTLEILKDFCLRKDYSCRYTTKDISDAVKKSVFK